jgi:hypothetical protein
MQLPRTTRELVFEADPATVAYERVPSLRAFEVAPPAPHQRRARTPSLITAPAPAAAKKSDDGLPLWPLWIALATLGLSFLFPNLQHAVLQAVNAFAG